MTGFLHPAWRTVFKRAYPRPILLDTREDTGNASSYTFTAVNLIFPSCLQLNLGTNETPGTGSYPRAANKYLIIVTVHTEDSATVFSVTNVTLGGLNGNAGAGRGGATNAINSATYWWGAGDLAGIANTDVVVTASEAITGCAIGVIAIDNMGATFELGAGNDVTGTGIQNNEVNVNQNDPVASVACMLYVTTCATGGGTERVQFSPELASTASGVHNFELLYEKSNAEFDYAAAFAVFPGWIPPNIGANPIFGGVNLDWSGTGAFDLVVTGFQ